MSIPDGYIRVGRAASILGLDPNVLANYVRSGDVRAMRLPNNIRLLLLEDVEALKARMYPDGQAPPTPPLARTRAQRDGRSRAMTSGHRERIAAQLCESDTLRERQEPS
jgi:hypothetical protein